MITVNLTQPPKHQFINLFNASNNSNYTTNDLAINSWRREGSTTVVAVETLKESDAVDIPTATVKFTHVPLSKLFERIHFSFPKLSITDGNKDLDLTKFYKEMTRHFNLYIDKNDYTVKYDKALKKIVFKATNANIVYTGEVVFNVADPIFTIIQINPYFLYSSGQSNYIMTYFRDFEYPDFLELDNNGKFVNLSLLNEFLVGYYYVAPVTNEMSIVKRLPDVSKGDRANCTSVVIVKPTEDKWSWYYFHTNNH